jgi:hypothetical protein
VRKPFLLLLALAAPLLAVGPAGAQTAPASGQVQMTAHTHSSGTLLFPVQRLAYQFAPGTTFSYSSRLCSASAPFNDIGLNFVPDYPGVDSARGTAAVRHHVEGTIIASNGTTGAVSGRITTVLCVPGPSANGQVESGNAIVSYFWASFQRVSDNDLRITGGFQFSPTESTGTFRDISGGGRIEGRFTCLGRLSDPTAPSCAQLGEYTDFVASTGDPTLPAGRLQPGILGVFYDPTVGPVAGPSATG